MGYKDELVKAMEWLATKPDTVFMGQAIGMSGHAISNTVATVSQDKRVELPVFEETQMGIATGMAMTGWVPITAYPRFDFSEVGLISGFDQAHITGLGLIFKQNAGQSCITCECRSSTGCGV